MKTILKIEEFFMFVLALYLFSLLEVKWWLFAALFLAPDLGLLGYLINSKTGAFLYNILHHKGIAIALYLVGILLSIPSLMFIGLLLFAHSSFDRILGFGLKYQDSFKHTHLGTIGKVT